MRSVTWSMVSFSVAPGHAACTTIRPECERGILIAAKAVIGQPASHHHRNHKVHDQRAIIVECPL